MAKPRDRNRERFEEQKRRREERGMPSWMQEELDLEKLTDRLEALRTEQQAGMVIPEFMPSAEQQEFFFYGTPPEEPVADARRDGEWGRYSLSIRTYFPEGQRDESFRVTRAPISAWYPEGFFEIRCGDMFLWRSTPDATQIRLTWNELESGLVMQSSMVAGRRIEKASKDPDMVKEQGDNYPPVVIRVRNALQMNEDQQSRLLARIHDAWKEAIKKRVPFIIPKDLADVEYPAEIMSRVDRRWNPPKIARTKGGFSFVIDRQRSSDVRVFEAATGEELTRTILGRYETKARFAQEGQRISFVAMIKDVDGKYVRAVDGEIALERLTGTVKAAVPGDYPWDGEETAGRKITLGRSLS
jgi:hypothetical protein